MDWMFQSLESLHPVIQALIATLFTWGMTAVGAGVIFFTKNVSRRFLDTSLGFAAGVMIAASHDFVVVEEVVPESQQGGNTDVATMGAMIGFAVMMTLDVALG